MSRFPNPSRTSPPLWNCCRRSRKPPPPFSHPTDVATAAKHQNRGSILADLGRRTEEKNLPPTHHEPVAFSLPPIERGTTSSDRSTTREPEGKVLLSSSFPL
ncbi:unnamed protein product [Linum trigynum]|uniref:Uncharacterized protein n=1 Tax=Linum trigynum TaxID=586398 RepID=A0AAV2D7Z2_9ROSI